MSAAACVLGMLFTGSINTISKKIQNNCVARGMDGEIDKFHYPYTQTLFMFSGEFFCLAFLIIMQRYVRRKERDLKEGQTLLGEPQELTESEKAVLNLPKMDYKWFVLAMCCDLMGTTMGGIGLLYTNASVFQMLRASVILFVAALRKIFRKKVFFKYQYTGLAIVTLALVTVGFSSVKNAAAEQKDTKTDSGQVVFGDVLIIIGMLFSAIQMVLEESYVQSKNYHPLQVVGVEGLFGFVATLFIVLPAIYIIPGHDHGHYEDSPNGFYMMGQNHLLLYMGILYTCSIAFYNFFGLMVTKRLSSVHRTLIDASRTICVWLTMLCVYYLGGTNLGEKWGPWSWLQFVGFCILVTGTMIYNTSFYPPPAVPATIASVVQPSKK